MLLGSGVLRPGDGVVNTHLGPVIVRGPGPNGSLLYVLYGWVPQDACLLYWVECDELWADEGLTSDGTEAGAADPSDQ